MSQPFDEPAFDAGFDPREKARMASTFGVISVVLCLATPCASCFSLMAALPMGLVAIQQARAVQAVSSDEVALVQARHGQITGMISVIYSAILLTLILAYIGLYVALIGFVVAVG